MPMRDEVMRCLFVINDGPYGRERPDNALRPAIELSKVAGVHVRAYPVGDAVWSPQAGQETPSAFNYVERMPAALVRCGEVVTQAACARARGLEPGALVYGIIGGSMKLLPSGPRVLSRL